MLCFDTNCRRPLGNDVVLYDLLKEMGMKDLIARHQAKARLYAVNNDPLVRWCSNQTCGRYMKVQSPNVAKVMCQECS